MDVDSNNNNNEEDEVNSDDKIIYCHGKRVYSFDTLWQLLEFLTCDEGDQSQLAKAAELIAKEEWQAILDNISNQVYSLRRLEGYGVTGLIVAAQWGLSDIVEALLKRDDCDKAYITQFCGNNHNNALHTAIGYRQEDIVRLLLTDDRSDIDFLSLSKGSTSLASLLQSLFYMIQRFDNELISEVLSLDYLRQTPDSDKILRILAGRCLTNGYMDKAALVLGLSDESDVDAAIKAYLLKPSHQGRTPLQQAVYYRQTYRFEPMLDWADDDSRLALLSVKSGGGYSALHIACEGGVEEVITRLLDRMSSRDKSELLTMKNDSGLYPLDCVSNSKLRAKLILANCPHPSKEIIESKLRRFRRTASQVGDLLGHFLFNQADDSEVETAAQTNKFNPS